MCLGQRDQDYVHLAVEGLDVLHVVHHLNCYGGSDVAYGFMFP